MSGQTTISMDVVINRADFERLMEVVHPRVVLKTVGDRLKAFVDESFQTRGRGGWRPLAASTLAQRIRGGDAPLQDTGRYRGSFVRDTDNQTYVEVGTGLKAENGAALGPIHEFGTRPYTIRVRRARVLAAPLRGGGYAIFGRSVNHPGIPARPVLPTVTQAETILEPVLEGMLQRAIDGRD